MVAAALRDGYDRIVAVGGDGSLSAAVNGFFHDDKPIADQAILAHVPSGTGADFPRTLGGSLTIDAAIKSLRGNHTRRIDVGKLTYTGDDGNRQVRFFVNEASFGMSAAVVDLSNKFVWLRRMSGTLAFYSASVTKLMSHRNSAVRLIIDDHFDREVKTNTVFVCNGQYAGGGMWVAPMASLDDGYLDVVILGDLNIRDSVRLTATIYRGKHLNHPHVTSMRGRKLIAESTDEVHVEVDGEVLGRLPATFEVMPTAIQLCCPA